MKKVLLWLWQLPQNIAGFILSITCKSRWYNEYTCVYFKYNFFGSAVSLGNYVIADICNGHNYTMVRHEHGHQIQSRILGPLYLLLIGLPSLLGNIYARIFHKDSEWYYKQPWEAWADKLGGVTRD